MVRLLGGVGKNIEGRCNVDKGLETGSYVVLLKKRKKKKKTEKTASPKNGSHVIILGF